MFGIAFGSAKKKANKKVQAKRSQAKRKQPAREFKLQWRKVYAWPLVVMLLAIVVMLLPNDELFPLQKIRISGQFSELDTKQLEQQLRPQLGVGFFALNIDQVQQQLLQHPWVSRVSINRIWPNELSVGVVERQAYARWDDKHLLSHEGEVFMASGDEFAALPLINGYAKHSVEVLKRFVQTQKRLTAKDIQIAEYREDSKGALTLRLTNGLAVSLGSESLQAKLDQLVAVYDLHIKHRSNTIQHIDFRYSNGFAVAWKPEYLNERSALLQRGANNV